MSFDQLEEDSSTFKPKLHTEQSPRGGKFSVTAQWLCCLNPALPITAISVMRTRCKANFICLAAPTITSIFSPIRRAFRRALLHMMEVRVYWTMNLIQFTFILSLYRLGYQHLQTNMEQTFSPHPSYPKQLALPWFFSPHGGLFINRAFSSQARGNSTCTSQRAILGEYSCGSPFRRVSMHMCVCNFLNQDVGLSFIVL